MKKRHMQEVQIRTYLRESIDYIEVMILLSKPLEDNAVEDQYWNYVYDELVLLGADVAIDDSADLCGVQWGFETIET